MGKLQGCKSVFFQGGRASIPCGSGGWRWGTLCWHRPLGQPEPTLLPSPQVACPYVGCGESFADHSTTHAQVSLVARSSQPRVQTPLQLPPSSVCPLWASVACLQNGNNPGKKARANAGASTWHVCVFDPWQPLAFLAGGRADSGLQPCVLAGPFTEA